MWQLRSEASTKYRVEFFASATCDAVGRADAERSLGSPAINTTAEGSVENVWELPGRVAPGEYITATATKFVLIDGAYVATDRSELARCLRADLCTGTRCPAEGPFTP